ncbi:MAG: type I restriction endonuclease subunit R, partial [Phycisphaerales bacterium JB038]
MSRTFSESVIEQAALAWLKSTGWSVANGPDIAPDGSSAERTDYREVVLAQRLRESLARLNPDLPHEALEEAYRKLTKPEGPALAARNRAFHRLVVDGVPVEYRNGSGAIRGAQATVVDFDSVEANDWLAVGQFTVKENKRTRRPDVVLFLNGLPIGLIELKNAANEDATIWAAFRQLQTYKSELPTLFAHNELLVVSDGTESRVGTLTAGREWFKPWRPITGETLADGHTPELQVVIEGLLAPARVLAMIRDFIVFEDDGGGDLIKKMAGYHQFHAVLVAVGETLRASEARLETAVAEPGRYGSAPQPGGKRGDQRVGVVWHTQGSGKSLTMVFYAGRIVREPGMENPTLVVLTDRNDLDDQLFNTFSRCQDLLRQPPVQATDRDDRKKKLAVASGGVVFTTIQKFLPEETAYRYPVLSERRNIVVIADEAHRSQYDFIDGFARHMRDALPHASFIGFTGTPIEKTDANTRAVFGDYISVYDIQRAVDDGATVPIYYESRLAQLELDEAE